MSVSDKVCAGRALHFLGRANLTEGSALPSSWNNVPASLHGPPAGMNDPEAGSAQGLPPKFSDRRLISRGYFFLKPDNKNAF